MAHFGFLTFASASCGLGSYTGEPSDFAKLGEHLSVEVGANPETCDPDQVIQHRPRSVNQSRALCLRDHAKKTSDGQP
jgi:hypothetical protein